MTGMVSWGNLGGDTTKSGGSMFMKLKEGKNTIRIVGTLYKFWQHYSPSVRCSGTETCPLCKTGNAAKARFAMNVFDRDDGKLKVLEVGKQVIDGIVNYVETLDIDPGKNQGPDFIIKKEVPAGNPINTKYSVISNSKPMPFSDEEKDFLQKTGLHSLEEIKKPHTPQEILAKMQEKGIDADAGTDSSEAVQSLASEDTSEDGGIEW